MLCPLFHTPALVKKTFLCIFPQEGAFNHCPLLIKEPDHALSCKNILEGLLTFAGGQTAEAMESLDIILLLLPKVKACTFFRKKRKKISK